eukprot:UN26161
MKKLFERECKILKKLDHVNCIKIIGGYEDANNYYIVTTLCSGGELFHRITARSELCSEDEGRTLCRYMLTAVQHTHNKGVIHRDLKPE